MNTQFKLQNLDSIALSKLVAEGVEELKARSLLNSSYDRLATAIANNAMKNAALGAAGLTLNKYGISDDEPVGFMA